ncbi:MULTISPECIES: sulfite exporter TauE/SafE family protein [Nostoc]|uniref:Probable membrane transporter protein n=1 Tax=Nostoc paludosum FACHB-159 TaxID=2692908 RepID=A0ABR8KE06_9NOSO|nr:MULTISPECIES: sulfite exporter TauE/SafE family protein [Nostoc]MBD2681300.1 sulfite exporter TauE/SafE family protein [Nostoc sp. FACHB-857]MBD2737779.1 sulfite exporter TauE/SafE family protein [Nostoc paludosum FACHB-159]
MNILEFTLLVWLGSATAGFLGALTGLGGGVVLVPLLTLVFHVDIRYAIGASLVSVIATSSGAASAYVKEGYTNLRLGMFLEVATTFGAIAGAIVAAYTPTKIIAVAFGLILLYSAYLSHLSHSEHQDNKPPDALATRLRLNSTYPTPEGEQAYNVHAVKAGFSLMFVAGMLSGLLGIGSGALKVLAMDRFMQIPFKVSTTTSNFMIGVTAAASAGVYLKRGYIDPGLAMPVMLGVVLGALLGAKILVRTKVGVLRTIFSLVISLLGIQMIFNGFTGRI